MKTYIFFEEGKEKKPEFEVEASNSNTAYIVAYNSYGPQVDDLLYMQKPEKRFCDAMGHFGAPPKYGTCEKCNQPY